MPKKLAVNPQKLSSIEVSKMLGISRPTLYKWIDEPGLNFPQPSMVGTKRTWTKEQIEDWQREYMKKAG
jgi:excisionase family DNA binding protein